MDSTRHADSRKGRARSQVKTKTTTRHPLSGPHTTTGLLCAPVHLFTHRVLTEHLVRARLCVRP